MKIHAAKSQPSVGATGADTPNYILETSLNEATPSTADEALYTGLEAVENDDNDLLWYPMHIRHSNPKKARRVRDELTRRGLTTYLRLKYHEAIVDDELRDIATPALNNLIFVHVQKKVIRHLKNTECDLTSLQFMTKPKRDRTDKTVIITVPEHAMNQFIQAEVLPDPYKQRVNVDYRKYIDLAGRRVKIIRGPFAGIEGEIKHIGGHRIIVVKLQNLGLATGIAYVKQQDMVLL
ncbi:MAG: hypothetical protein IJ700_01475 [Bacteroidaceae bacterium]|nr:hypothetical protein [Bacteroidaceae bacterium]